MSHRRKLRHRFGLPILLALAFAGGAAAAKPATFKENLPLAQALMRQVNALEPAYRIREINCRTLDPLPVIGVGAIPTECLTIAVNGNRGLFCGILYVTVAAPQQALAFAIDHSDPYPCGQVAKVLAKLKARGLVAVPVAKASKLAA